MFLNTNYFMCHVLNYVMNANLIYFSLQDILYYLTTYDITNKIS